MMASKTGNLLGVQGNSSLQCLNPLKNENDDEAEAFDGRGSLCSQENGAQLIQEDPRELIPDLCRLYYHFGWMLGSGGSISMRQGDKIYISPSGVLKERIQREDLFVLNLEGEELDVPPPYKKLHRSSCTPNFLNAYTLRKAGSVMHIHSRNAVLATLLYPGSEIRLTHLQMIKGIHNPTTGVNFNYDHEIVIPVIENTREEVGLKVPMAEAMINYPEASAILVRRHGIYVWGDTWKQTKVMLECFEHLLDLAVHMKMAGLNPSEAP